MKRTANHTTTPQQELMGSDGISLNELRSGGQSTAVFKKKFMGGYHPKEVAEYIDGLKENLRNAERSFHEKLEEINASTAMLTQERDKYLQMVKENEERQDNMRRAISELTRQNRELTAELEDLSKKEPDPEELHEYENALSQNSALKVLVEELEQKVAEYERYKYDNIKLQSANDQLESAVAELKNRADEFSKNIVMQDQYDGVLRENSLIKDRYEQAMSENSRLNAECSVLTEQNKRLTDNLVRTGEANKRLRTQNVQIRLKARSMKSDFESKAFECVENHKHNMDQITESIKGVLNLICYENVDLSKLLSGDYDELDFENLAIDTVGAVENGQADCPTDTDLCV